jgi:hypothetical protein
MEPIIPDSYTIEMSMAQAREVIMKLRQAVRRADNGNSTEVVLDFISIIDDVQRGPTIRFAVLSERDEKEAHKHGS